MNLLKVLMLVCLAASLSLLIPVNAHAVDHPWDDNTPDSSRVTGETGFGRNNAGDTPRPFITPIVHRISDWARGVIRDVRDIFSREDRQEIKGKVIDKNQRPNTPVVNRKHK